MTKSGKVPLLFMKWKALPNQNAKKGKGKAMRFESGIARMHFRRLK